DQLIKLQDASSGLWHTVVCSMIPVTGPGLILKGPKLMLDPNFPLFMRWPYLPKLLPWLARYLSHANDKDTRRIAAGLAPIVSDSLQQHKALTDGTDTAKWVQPSAYSFAYADRAAFDADAYIWDLRKDHGFVPELIEGAEVHEFEPALASDVNLLASFKSDHGFIHEPGGYVADLSKLLVEMGGTFVQAEVRDFDLSGGEISAVETDRGRFECDQAVLATGVWSKPLMKKLGINVPIESERGYHIVYKNPENGPKSPIMVAA
ncbi:MAG TPA: FAD-dependent oxidoreductase, partial [Rhizobiales bacterium]|nr:FAD-dependent oxidoreductase [Hyphomicrobiales bacterium]